MTGWYAARAAALAPLLDRALSMATQRTAIAWGSILMIACGVSDPSGTAGQGGSAGASGSAATGSSGGVAGSSGSAGAGGSAGADADACYREPRVPDVFEPPCDQPSAVSQCSNGWCTIPAGCFIEGSSWCEWGRNEDGLEDPRQVTLTHSFEIQQFETQLSEWGTYDLPPSTIASSLYQGCLDPECPVASVSFSMAVHYANLVSRRAGLEDCYRLTSCSGSKPSQFKCNVVETIGSVYECKGYRLPTNAEWEYAARAGAGTAFYNGEITPQPALDRCGFDPALNAIAWDCTDWRYTTFPVGRKQPNAWGLYDMIGNVPEWAGDSYPELPRPATPQVDPGAHLQFGSLAWRGEAGGMMSPGQRIAYQDFGMSAFPGIRLVRTLPTSAP